MKPYSKKFILKILTTIILLIFLCIITNYIYGKYISKINFENKIVNLANLNQKQIFNIEKIILFSSANAKQNETKNKAWNLNISQYTDIIIYINNQNSIKGLTKENTIKYLYIDNIKFKNIGENINLSYLNPNDIGKGNLVSENIINKKLEYNILNPSINIDYSNPQLYNDFSIPISLKYSNKNIKENYLIIDTENPLVFDGTLLKRGNINLETIENTVSFTIHIINSENHEFIYNLLFKIPLENNEKSIYEGNITKTLNNLTTYNFYRLH